MMRISKGTLGGLIITLFLLVMVSDTAGEEHSPAQTHQEPPSLQVRGTEQLGKQKISGKEDKMKSRNKNLQTKSGKSEKGDRGKNISKRRSNEKQQKKKNRTKKTGKRRNNRRKEKIRETSSCHNLMCLNNLALVLKIDKDTVQNFMQQKIRIDRRLRLIHSKGGKNKLTMEAMLTLQESLGGADALKNNRPFCWGRYNTTDAIQGQAMYNNFSQCPSLISTACNFSMPTDETAELEACSKVMRDFR